MDLVIMAAGMGSRFGGLKQLEPINENGEFIIDYSIYDALKVGFNRVVFIIKEENYDVFRQTVGKRIENHIQVEYVFQDNKVVPGNIQIPTERVKPLGTVHALLSCKDVVKDKFIILNADDFYGEDVFKILYDFLERNSETYALPGYDVRSTLSENGTVKRGICRVDEEGNLTEIIESSVYIDDEDKIMAKPLNGSEEFVVTEDEYCSMNIFAFQPEIFKYAEERLAKYLINHKDSLMTCEYLLRDIIIELVSEGVINMQVLDNKKGIWLGVTYKEDLPELKTKIKQLSYPTGLWKN